MKGLLANIIIPLAMFPKLSLSARATAAPQAPSSVTSGAVGTLRLVSITTARTIYRAYLVAVIMNLWTDLSSLVLARAFSVIFTASFIITIPAIKIRTAIRRLPPYSQSFSKVFSLIILHHTYSVFS